MRVVLLVFVLLSSFSVFAESRSCKSNFKSMFKHFNTSNRTHKTASEYFNKAHALVQQQSAVSKYSENYKQTCYNYNRALSTINSAIDSAKKAIRTSNKAYDKCEIEENYESASELNDKAETLLEEIESNRKFILNAGYGCE